MGISLRKLFRQERGHHGHKGRPGKVGGSLPRSGGARGGADYGDKERIGGFKREEYLTDVDMVGGHLDFRQLGERGMFPVTSHGLQGVGEEIDFYGKDGNKLSGKVLSYSGDKISIRAADPDSGKFDGDKYTLQMVDWKTGKPVTK